METPAFNLHTLQELSFKRCKQWGEVLQKFEENKEDEETEMNWSDVSTLFKDDVEKDHDDEIAPDEAVESDVSSDSSILKDVTNFSRVLKSFSDTQRNSTRLSQLELPLVAAGATVAENNNNKEQEIRDLLDETIPVLQEHKRRLKESGIDRVLNTFDPQKVEEKVGTWLRRQNTGPVHAVHGHHPRAEHRLPAKHCRHAEFQRYPAPYRSGSESESLHSVDTARYIRSSRQRHSAHRKVASGSSMTIKTFRLVKSKRDNLRQKYTVRVDADEEEALAVHRRCASHRKAPPSKYTELGLATGSHAIVKRPPQRSKVLRKRRSVTHRYELGDYGSSSCYSSDEDQLAVENAAYGCCARSQAQQLQKHQSHLAACKCSARRQPTRQCQSLCCRRSRGRVCHMSSFTSSSSTSFVESQSTSRSKKSAIATQDYRPWRRESDCGCCNQEMLCSSVRHIADISTESWLVENYESPRKSRTGNVPTGKARIFERNYEAQRRDALRHSESSPEVTEKRLVPLRSEKPHPHRFGDNHRTPMSLPQNRLKESKARVARKSRKVSYSRDETDDDTSTERNATTKTTRRKGRETSHSKENQQNGEASESDDEDFVKNLQLAIEISKKSFQKESKKPTQQEDTAAKQQALCQKTEADRQKDAYIAELLMEDTVKTSKPRPMSMKPRKIKDNPEWSTKKPTKPKVKRTKDLVAPPQKKREVTGNDLKEAHKISANSTETTSVGSRVELSSPMSTMSLVSLSELSHPTFNDITALTEKSLKPQPKSAKQKKLSQLMRKMTTNDGETQDGTFMQGNERVYNSTAIGVNDCTAVSRQITIESTSSATNNHKVYTPAPKSKKVEKSQSTAKVKARALKKLTPVNSEDDDTKAANDCTVVTSTTDSDPIKSHKGILLYAPDFTTMAPEHSIRNGYFTITEEHLGRVAGVQSARKFMKYHIGHKRFDCSKTRVYYRPPEQQVISDSDSDVDVFERVGRYGELHVSIDASGR